MTTWPSFPADDEAAGETMRVLPRDAGDEFSTPASPGYAHPPSGPPYPTGSSGAPYGASAPYGPPRPPVISAPLRARNPSIAPMFMVTVMVVVLVLGAVSVVYLLTAGPGGASEPGPAAASAPASTSPSAASRIDACLVGEWKGTKFRITDNETGLALSTDNGDIYRIRDDGSGEEDFGSGVTLKDENDTTVEAMILGKIGVTIETANQTFTYREVNADARMVIFKSGRTVSNERYGADGTTTSLKYVCSGDVLRFTADDFEAEYRRR